MGREGGRGGWACLLPPPGHFKVYKAQSFSTLNFTAPIRCLPARTAVGEGSLRGSFSLSALVWTLGWNHPRPVHVAGRPELRFLLCGTGSQPHGASLPGWLCELQRALSWERRPMPPSGVQGDGGSYWPDLNLRLKSSSKGEGLWALPVPGAGDRAKGRTTVHVTESPLPSDSNISNTDIYNYPQRLC